MWGPWNGGSGKGHEQQQGVSAQRPKDPPALSGDQGRMPGGRGAGQAVPREQQEHQDIFPQP